MSNKATDDESPSVLGAGCGLPPMPTQEDFRAAHKSEYVRLFVEVGVPAETAAGWHDEGWEGLKDRTPQECFDDETEHWEGE
jgi:hypothetical protein